MQHKKLSGKKLILSLPDTLPPQQKNCLNTKRLSEDVVKKIVVNMVNLESPSKYSSSKSF